MKNLTPLNILGVTTVIATIPSVTCFTVNGCGDVSTRPTTPSASLGYATIEMDYASLYTAGGDAITDDKDDWMAVAYTELPSLWSGYTSEELFAIQTEEKEQQQEQKLVSNKEENDNDTVTFFPSPNEQTQPPTDAMNSSPMGDALYSTAPKYFDINLP
jgi:hypothetical protein